MLPWINIQNAIFVLIGSNGCKDQRETKNRGKKFQTLGLEKFELSVKANLIHISYQETL